MREEHRWLREESRWNAERQALLQEINSLKLRIQELERLNSLQGTSVSETVANIAKLVQVYTNEDVAYFLVIFISSNLAIIELD